MENFSLTSFADDRAMTLAVATAWLDETAALRRAGKPQFVALSGGRSAKNFFAAVAAHPRASETLSANTHFFWADERCVPPNDTESNYRIAEEIMFAPLKIPASHVHRIRCEKPPDLATSDAGGEIRRIAPVNADGQPVLDLIFLGMGEDGHVASLFPGEPETAKTDKAIYRTIKNSPKPPSERVTLGYAAIAAARQVWVLVSGAGKMAALRESLAPSGHTPLAQVIRSRSHTRIFADVPLR